jgi:hypothetical protein
MGAGLVKQAGSNVDEDRPVGSGRLDAAEEGRGSGEDGVVVMGKREKIPALKVRATVTEIFGDGSDLHWLVARMKTFRLLRRHFSCPIDQQ